MGAEMDVEGMGAARVAGLAEEEKKEEEGGSWGVVNADAMGSASFATAAASNDSTAAPFLAVMVVVVEPLPMTTLAAGREASMTFLPAMNEFFLGIGLLESIFILMAGGGLFICGIGLG